MDPETEAFVVRGERTTYAQWLDAAGRVARGFGSVGVGPGDRVALLGDNRSEWLDVMMGAAAVNAPLALFNTWTKLRELDYLLQHARPQVLVTVARAGHQDFLAVLSQLVPELWQDPPGDWRSDRYPHLRTVVVIGDDAPAGAIPYHMWLEAGGTGVVPNGGAPEDTAVIVYTSGSTANPKAVPLVHSDLVENGYWIGERQGLTNKDRIFFGSPLFWAFGVANALMASLTHGSTLVLQPQFHAEEALDLIESEACTVIYTLPAITHALLAAAGFSKRRVSSLRTGVMIGPPSEVTLVAEQLGVDGICNIYGSTEVYGNCCVTPHDAPLERRKRSQGPPLPGVDLRILDPETRDPVAEGVVGEILVRGRVTPGYLDDAGVASAVVDEDGFFATGDLGSVDSEGWLTFAARATEMIKTGGINVSPAEVEEFLASHPDVKEVAVAGGAHEIRGEQVVAFVVPVAHGRVNAEELRTFCREHIAGYKVPAAITIVDALPLTGTGKLARKQLKEWADEALEPSGKGPHADR